MQDEFAKRGIALIAVAKEMREQNELTKTARRYPERAFRLGGLPQGEGLEAYANTSGYLIDAEGTIRQVFPMEAFNRPSWWAILKEADRVLSD